MSNIVYPRYKAWKANGTSPAAGYYLYTYASGTTIPKVTYSDAALTSPNANPIILDSNGEAVIFSAGSGDYRFDLKTPLGALINTFDPVANILGGLIGGTATGFVNNIAELRALAVTATALVDVLGYYAGGDKGGGQFWFDPISTAADNQGTIIRPNSLPATGRWTRIWTPPVSLKWFGWTGAGGASDTTALAAYVAYTAALTLGGETYSQTSLTLHHLDTNKANLKFLNLHTDTLASGIEWAASTAINTVTAKIWNDPLFTLNFLTSTGTIDFYAGLFQASDKVLSIDSNYVTIPATQGLKVTDLAGGSTRIATVLTTGEISVGAAVSTFLTGSGTLNTVPLFTGANTLGNSLLVYATPYFTSTIGIKVNLDLVSLFPGTGTLPSLSSVSALPILGLKNTIPGLDAKDHRIVARTNGNLEFSLMNDAGSFEYIWLTLARSGTTPSVLTLAPASTILTGTLGVTGDVAVNTNKFNVTAASGNTTVAGTLVVTGASILSSTLRTLGTSAFGGAPIDTRYAMSIGAANVSTQGSGVNQWGLIIDPLSGTDASSNYFALYITARANSTLTNLVSHNITTSVKTGGTVANNYGLLIDNQTVGTNNWAIKTGTGLVDFGQNVLVAGTLGVTGLLSASQITTTGNVGIGVATSASTALDVRAAGIAGATQYGIAAQPTFSSGVTIAGNSLYAQLVTVASVFTMTTGRGLFIASPSIGASSVVTTLIGIDIANQTGGGTNFAIRAGTGLVTLADTTDATTITTGSLQTLGGVGITKALWVGGLANITGVVTIGNNIQRTAAGNLIITNTNAAGSGINLQTTSGDITLAPVGKIQLTPDAANNVSINNVTDSTSIITGSLVTTGGIGVAKRLTLDGGTGKTLRIANSVANAAVAVTIGLGPTGSTAGAPQGWMRIDINGTDRYIPFW